MKCFSIVLIILLCTASGFAQDYQSKSELEKEILGSWFRENAPESKVVFYDTGTVEYSYKDQTDSIGTYEITDTCDGAKTQDGGFFLKQTLQNGSSHCLYIESINYNGNGFFSMMTKQRGKIMVYKRDDI